MYVVHAYSRRGILIYTYLSLRIFTNVSLDNVSCSLFEFFFTKLVISQSVCWKSISDKEERYFCHTRHFHSLHKTYPQRGKIFLPHETFSFAAQNIPTECLNGDLFPTRDNLIGPSVYQLQFRHTRQFDWSNFIAVVPES